MSSQIDEVEGVIRDTLREMTAGAPSRGLRGRVLAGIGGASGLEPGTPGRLGRVRWTALVVPLEALAVVGVAVALVLPQLLKPGPTIAPLARQDSGASTEILSSPATRSEARAGVYSAKSSTNTAGSETRQLVAPEASGRTRGSAHDVRPVPSAWRPWPSDDASTESTIVVIAPLGDPAPIAVKPITLTPLEFQPVTSDEIEIPLLESSWPPKAPNQID
jgi:hypothetical protein